MTQEQITIMKDLMSVTAKRNTALTVIESKDIEKSLVGIKRRISAIKHDNKRGQLMSVVKHLEKHLAETKVKTGVFCIALKVNGELYYKHIDVEVPQKDQAYYYDDVFHILKIQEIVFQFKRATDKEIEFLEKTVNLTDGQKQKPAPDYEQYSKEFYVDKEIDPNIQNIKTIYHIVKSEEPRVVPLNWIEEGCTIRLILDHNFDEKVDQSTTRHNVGSKSQSSPLTVYKDVGL